MKVSDIKLVLNNEYCQLQATIYTDVYENEPYDLWFRVPLEYKDSISVTANPFLALVLLPCMVTGEQLDIEGEVSFKLFQSLSTIQQIYKSWDKNLHRIKINVWTFSKHNQDNVAYNKSAVFFSGGVDSLYTLLKQVEMEKESPSPALEYLVLVRGFDIPTTEAYDALFHTVIHNSAKIAKQLNKTLLTVATNIREFIDLFVPWGPFGHGSCLASTGLIIKKIFNTIYIGSTYSYKELIPWGSHPLLDPLWATEELTFIHDGCESSRLEKLRFISQFPLALKSLRVCYEYSAHSDRPDFNCGRCSKCLRTMIGLHIVGALDQCPVFPQQIEPELIQKLDISQGFIFMQDLFHSLQDTGFDLKIKSALLKAFKSGGMDPYLNINTEKIEQLYLRQKSLSKINNELDILMEANQKFILVDQEEIRLLLKRSGQAIPFLEREGIYDGPPSNEETAIIEFQRLYKEEVKYIVFAWPAFWWLDYYKGWNAYLRSKFCCVLNNERLVVFDMRKNVNEPGIAKIENDRSILKPSVTTDSGIDKIIQLTAKA